MSQRSAAYEDGIHGLGRPVADRRTHHRAGSTARHPASSLSVAKSVRASGPAAKGDKLAGGGGVLAAIILAGFAAIGVFVIVNDNDDGSDSN
ncbi:hypothetical protein SAMN05192583_1077 [Sphingomonas gellani]|uniref:Uncharacterized protein n=1 Tax=Sphingomonas gellani TaxID=1166340 RepID=A0A1H8AVV4_9SPHN|nr:hypothetical protein [Sphingomonas gellani]SEM74606.1 hypothetical protein SAMN05192583_1077 [Sphingomonas gellani]